MPFQNEGQQNNSFNGDDHHLANGCELENSNVFSDESFEEISKGV